MLFSSIQDTSFVQIPCCVHHLPHQKSQSGFGMAANTAARLKASLAVLSSSAPPMASL